MEFRHPLLFLLAIPIVALFFWMLKDPSRFRAKLRFSHLKLLSGKPETLKSRLRFLDWILKGLSLIALVAAIARPQTSNNQIKRQFDGIDIMIVLDISDSMLIEDMKPLNRLESAKETIKAFVSERRSDRIGLIVFAGESFTLVPLTIDYKLLLHRIDEIQTAQTARIKDGTALGVALANGSARLRESTAKSRVMIFLTDGENNSGTIDPNTGLEIAKGYGLKIYSIGIGKDGPTKIPVYHRDPFGNRIKTYQPFESTVNEELLSRIADQTGGKYFRATREDSLQGVFEDINRLEKSKVNVNELVRWNEEFSTPLKWSLFLWLLAEILSFTWLKRFP
jgi:Ca-activated chloride channel homolog